MKIDSRTEFVTLSDSLTSSLPKPLHLKGNAKVVCLDSDTESDGSCAQLCNYKLKPVDKTSKSSFVSCHNPNPSTEKNSEIDPGYLETSPCWPSLRKCRKESEIANGHGHIHNLDTPGRGSSNPTNSEMVHGHDLSHMLDTSPSEPSGSSNPSFQKDSETIHGHDHNHILDTSMSGPLSPRLEISQGHVHTHHILDTPLSESSKPDFGKNSEMAYCHGYKHILETSPCQSSLFELENYKFFERNHASEGIKDVRGCLNENIMDFQKVVCPQEPPSIYEFKSSFSLDLKSKNGQKHIQMELIDRILDIDNVENDTKATYKPCFSLDSDGSNDSFSGWNDHLKNVLRKSEVCEPNNEHVEDVYGHKSNTSPQDSVWKRKFHESTIRKKRDGELFDNGDSLSNKRTKKSSEQAKVLKEDVGKQNKGEKRVKDKDALEARKQKLKEEREVLRREKQEEKKRQQEAKKQKNEEERKRKEELRAEATERRKIEKEKGKWEKGKFALQNITAFVDTQILEGGLVGGHLLTRFAEKGFKYHLVQNPVKKTVIWKMQFPSYDSISNSQEDSQLQDPQKVESSRKSGPQLSMKSKPVSYVLIVLEAEEFVNMINEQVLDNHIKSLQKSYPGFTLCYLINKLMRYLHKREQQQFKNPGDSWIRPPVEQVLAKLITSYNGVHSRLCLDEAEVAEHIVGLTRSLAECPFKRKLSTLSLSANGDHVVKNDPNNDVIKKNLWMKALVALPKISGACAIAIAKKYPSMNALFEAYLDPSRTVHEKEFLLQDLMKEGLLGGESNRRVGPACSRRVYRIMMAQQGNLHTDDVEEGADLFRD